MELKFEFHIIFVIKYYFMCYEMLFLFFSTVKLNDL